MAGKFLGVDGKYHPIGSFLGNDGKYHPKVRILPDSDHPFSFDPDHPFSPEADQRSPVKPIAVLL